MDKNQEITLEQMEKINKLLIAKGLGEGEYFATAQVTVTDIKCPHCDKSLIVTQLGIQ